MPQRICGCRRSGAARLRLPSSAIFGESSRNQSSSPPTCKPRYPTRHGIPPCTASHSGTVSPPARCPMQVDDLNAELTTQRRGSADQAVSRSTSPSACSSCR
jgi:hypothetical protein